MIRTIAIIGATSGIAKAVAARFAREGCNLALAGRDEDELAKIASDLRIKYGIEAKSFAFEATGYEQHYDLWERMIEAFVKLDGVIVCHGYLGDQASAQRSFAEARAIIEINYLSCVSILEVAAAYFEARRTGFLCAISSVAGDRGRQSNYLYGSAKGALTLYLQGLRNRLYKSGVSVTTVKPGFVDTRMTQGAEGMFLVAKPDTIASGIYRAVTKRKNIVYLPGFWRAIMLIIRSIPETIFKRLNL